MNIDTHQDISHALCGRPLSVEEGKSRVALETGADMAVDGSGLVHGGFVFGLADHAAMIAVNHPNVVLGAAQVKFLKPVKAGETVTARAEVVESAGKKRMVNVACERGGENVFEGVFTCFVLDRHVLD